MDKLTENQWAKIHGHRAGRDGLLSRFNPYIKGFNDVDGTLHNIWEKARIAAKNGGHYNLDENEGK
jgi:hypothetical protein